MTAERGPKRGRLSLLLGTVFASVLFVAAAQADQLINKLDATVDADFEVLAIDDGGTGDVALYVNPTTGGGDTQNGCNLGGSSEAENVTFRATSSDTSVATLTLSTTLATGPNRTTISGGDFTVRQCASPSVPVVTVRVAAQGSGVSTRTADITIAVVADNAPGSFVADTARFRVNVAPPPNTAPTVAVTGVTNSASYPKGSVPAAGCTVSDAEDGLSGSTTAASPQVGPVVGPYAADGIGLQTVTCSYTDGGGLNAVASVTYGIADPSAPGVSPSVSGTLGSNGWYTSDVSLTWNVSEPDSPSSLLLTDCVPQSIVADQSEVTYSCTATSAGGSTGPVSQAIKRDASLPAYDCGTLPTGWQAANVVLSCTAQDVGPSGLATSGAFQLLTALAAGEESATAPTNAEVVADNAGNSRSAQYSFMVDRKAPVVVGNAAGDSCSLPGNGGWCRGEQTAGFAVSDGGSGLAPDGASARSVTRSSSVNGADIAIASGPFADLVGNSTLGLSRTFKIDSVAPTYDCGVVPTGWQGANVTLSCTAQDATSGLADNGDALFELATSLPAGEESAAVSTGNRVLADAAGNTATAVVAPLKIDLKAPVVACDAAPSAWSAVDVAVGCTAADGGSGLDDAADAAFQLTTSVPAGTETDNASTGTRSVADDVGNAATAGPVSGIRVDKKAPSVACDAAPTAWSASDVAVPCTAADGGSGLDDAADASFELTTNVAAGTETSNAATGTRTVLDDVGNTATAGPVSGIRVDKKAPVVLRNNGADACSLPGNNGWCRGIQVAGFTVEDGGSGLAPDGAASRSVTVSSAVNGSNVAIASGPFADLVGNSAPGISATFEIDSVPPQVTCEATPTLLARQLPGTVKATVTDATSGALATTVTGQATSPSGGKVSLTGYDNAGNSTTVDCAYRVGSFTFEQPIDGNALNVAKLGRVVPVKGVARIDGAIVTDGPLSIGAASRVDCATGLGTDEIEVYAAAGSSNTGNLFRWDATGQKWIYNFDTSVLGAGNCYRLNVYYGGTVSGGVATGGALIDYFLLRANR